MKSAANNERSKDDTMSNRSSIRNNNKNKSDEYALCSICFEALFEHSLGVMYHSTTPGLSQRSCPHILHYKCIKDWEVTNHKSCPQCRYDKWAIFA